jgi:gliding motility-associated-like protein
MKKIFFYIALVSGYGLFAQVNVPPPHVVNSAGGSVKFAGGNYYGYNIGEPIVGTVGPPTVSSNYYTQGFLQPDYKIGTAFNATIRFTNESCQGASDGSIIANAYNNKGKVKVSITPSPSAGDTTSTIVGLSPGTYTLTIHDSTTKTLQHIITIQASSETCPITVYHAFSPNGDGLNDVFIIDGIQNYTDNHVYFFNRWGTLVWDRAKYDNVKNVWDGKDNKGSTLDMGTYFYIIEITGKKPQKSWVEITK